MMHAGRTIPARQHAHLLMMVAVFLLGFVAPIAPLPARAEPSPSPSAAVASPVASAEVIDRTIVTIDFPVGLHFSGELTVPRDTTIVSLHYRGGFDDGWNLVDVPEQDLRRNADGSVSIDTTFDLQLLQVPLGVHLAYQWVATTPTATATSAIAATDWYDNRQPWQELASDQVRLLYYGMDATFAATILASAQGTIGDLERTYAVPRSQTLAIWVYPEATAFREGLPANFRESVVGGSVVGYPLIVAVIPPGSDSEVGRIIPHEISHQVLYQATRNPFGLTPTWFDEGMATHAQIGGTNGFLGMVVAANQRDGLLELDSLAGSFPYSPSQASLAYAESWSVIAFIESRWGAEGITALIHAFAEGLPTDDAISKALGLSMDAFTADWKSWIASQS